MPKVPGFARYGTREIVVALLAVAVLILLLFLVGLPWLGVVPALLLAWVLWFFRDPARRSEAGPGAVLSPADGRVTHIEEVEDAEFVGGRALMIGIFLSIFDVHLNRAPLTGRVAHIRYCPGSFHDARSAVSSVENESNSIGFETDAAGRVLVKQIAGLVARRIVCDCEIGDELERGQVLGMIKFGSRTEIYLPAERALEVRVKIGDKVHAGTTVLGVLP
jgi:phosphatidylserine decarboxylase